MIKKAIITCLLLFGGYSLFIIFVSPKWWHASQHQWQDNMIRAQNYIYDDKSNIKKIIVGSSLSCRLIMDSLPGMYNLSFSGQTIFDGLNMITHKTKFPDTVFIEMNVILKAETEGFTSSLNSPLLFYPRKVLPSLRFDKQPIAVIGNQINYRVDYFLTKFKYHFHLVEHPAIHQDSATPLFSKMLKLQLKSYSEFPDKQILNDRFTILKKYTDLLEKNGVTIVFFEMPVNYLLNELPKPKMIRECFHFYYPSLTYSYIPIASFMKYETTDGVHLKSSEALEYTHYFKSKVSNLKP